ncbi:MAG: hypothetical protein IJD48_02845, partial [Clostridia bacterium]|nr:hypothetical protein [Clostridia bacterium]
MPVGPSHGGRSSGGSRGGSFSSGGSRGSSYSGGSRSGGGFYFRPRNFHFFGRTIILSSGSQVLLFILVIIAVSLFGLISTIVKK